MLELLLSMSARGSAEHRRRPRRAAPWVAAIALSVCTACGPLDEEVDPESDVELAAQLLETDAQVPPGDPGGPCVRRPLQITLTPEIGQAQLAGDTVHYTIAVKNDDLGACPASSVVPLAVNTEAGFTMRFSPVSLSLAARASARFRLSAASPTTTAPATTTTLQFNVLTTQAPAQSLSVRYEVLPCTVDTARELMITHVDVVDDPLRTNPADSTDPRSGAWTFRRLMERMAPTPELAPKMVKELFETWTASKIMPNQLNLPARKEITTSVLQEWAKNGDQLDLSQAPMRLLAIVNRIDSHDVVNGHAGEGRFIFGVLAPTGKPGEAVADRSPLPFTIILEYRLPAKTDEDVRSWAKSWHALGALPLGSESYNAALQAITDRFTARNAEPQRVNGSSLAQLRTNELALGSPWEMREFELSPETGMLARATVKRTPHNLYMGPANAKLTAFVNENEAAILAGTHSVPATYMGGGFISGNSLVPFLSNAWRSTTRGIRNPEARRLFSLNTCNGCHGSQETGTVFLHVSPRSKGEESKLSGFLTGITVPDPDHDSASGMERKTKTYNDLLERNEILRGLVCPAPATGRLSAPAVSSAMRISREH